MLFTGPCSSHKHPFQGDFCLSVHHHHKALDFESQGEWSAKLSVMAKAGGDSVH